MRVLLVTLALMIVACAKPTAPAASPQGVAENEGGEGLHPREAGEVQPKTIEDLRAESFAAIDRAACDAEGGEIRQEGLLGTWRCVRPYADAGKECRDKADCEGKCLLSPESDALGGENAVGVCQANDSPFGCYAEINDGKVSAALCVD